MNRKQTGILLATGLASLTLAGCSNNSSSQQRQSTSSSASLIAKKSSVKVSAQGMSPQQSVSLVTAYAGNRYGGAWAQTAKQARQSGLQVNLYPTSRYQLSDNGQGMAYDVTAGGQANGLVYTIDQNDDVVIYQGAQPGKRAKKLVTISKPAMAKYVNAHGQGALVNDLAKNAQVVDKSGGATSNGNANAASYGDNATGKYGNKGPFAVPADMQGTWYSADHDDESTVTISDHEMNIDGDTVKLYHQDSQYAQDNDQPSDDQVSATKDWGRTQFLHDDGGTWLNIQGWFQGAGDGTSYMVKTENIDGKPVKVLVVGEGAENWVTAVYYPSKAMAQQQADQKYDDLHYQDDDD